MNERHDAPFEFEDDEVRKAYRGLPDDEVPAALDAHVLKAASAALAKQRKPRWFRWTGPVALAASVLVVVAVILEPGARKQVSVSSALQLPKAHSVPAAARPAQDELRANSADAVASTATLAKKPEEEKKAEAAVEPVPDIVVTEQRRQEVLANVPVAVSTVATEGELHLPPASPAPNTEEADRSKLSSASNQAVGSLSEEAKEQTAGSAAPAAATPAERASSQFSAAQAEAGSKQVRPIVPPPAAAAKSEEIKATAAAHRDPKLDAWLHKIDQLQSAGHPQRAAREIKKLQKAYPDLDIDTELQRIRSEDTPAP